MIVDKLNMVSRRNSQLRLAPQELSSMKAHWNIGNTECRKSGQRRPAACEIEFCLNRLQNWLDSGVHLSADSCLCLCDANEPKAAANRYIFTTMSQSAGDDAGLSRPSLIKARND